MVVTEGGIITSFNVSSLGPTLPTIQPVMMVVVPTGASKVPCSDNLEILLRHLVDLELLFEEPLSC